MKKEVKQNFFRRKQTLLIASLVLLVAASYLPAFQAGYVWDDKAVYENPALHDLDGLKRIWLAPSTLVPYEVHYWPVVHTTFWIEHQLWGTEPFGYHAVNILLHAANCLLLFYVLRRLKIKGAWVAAALFAVHPVHVASTAWIVERKDLLSFIFYIGAFYKFHRFTQNQKRIDYFISFLLFVPALLSKSVSVAFPAALLIWLWLLNKKLTLKRFGHLLPFFSAAIMYAFFDIRLAGQAEPLHFSYSMPEKFIIAGKAFWFYLSKLVWPAKIRAVYPHWTINPEKLHQFLFPLAAIALYLALFISSRKTGKGPSAAFLFFGINLAPVLGFIEFGYMRYSFAADRFQYLASAGPIVLFSCLFHSFYERASLPVKKISFISLSVLILILGYLSYQQASTYENKLTLFQHALKYRPASYIAHYNVAAELEKLGQIEQAVEHYKKVVRIKPDHGDTNFQLGSLLSRLGRLEEAQKYLSIDIKLRPGNVNSFINLGNALLRQRKTEQAIECYQYALKLEPENSLAHNNLGFCFAKQNEHETAVAHFRKALDSNPDSLEAHVNIARSLSQMNRKKQAARHYRETLRLDPDHIEALNNLAWIAATSENASLRNVPEAIRLAEKSCGLTGYRNISCLDTLAAAYAAAGNFQKAADILQTGLNAAQSKSDPRLLENMKSKLDDYRKKQNLTED